MNRKSKSGVLLSAVAFVLIVVAFATPGWLYIFMANYGLFYVCINIPGLTSSGCMMFQSRDFGISFIVPLGLLALAIVVMLPGIIFAIIGCIRDVKKLKHAGIFFIVGGILSIVAVVCFAALTLNSLPLPWDLAIRLFGYSFNLACVGSVLAIIGGALNVRGAKTSTVAAS